MAKIRHLSSLASLFVSTFILTANTYAAQPGLYLGTQLGWGNVSDTGISQIDMNHMIESAFGYNTFTVTAFNGTTSKNGFAWRVFGGYQVMYNWAAEIGWAEYPSLPVLATASGLDQATGLPYTADSTGTFKINVFDFVGKYMYLLPCQFNVYGKLGLAFLTGYSNASANVTETGFSGGGATYTDKITRLDPTFGVGISYDFRQDISADLSYNRIQSLGGSDELGSIDYVSFGFMLHFG